MLFLMSRSTVSRFIILGLLLISFFNVSAATTHHSKKKHTKQTQAITKKSKHKKSKTVAKATVSSPLNVTLQVGVDHIISQFSGINSNVGVLVESADNGTILYNYNANRDFTPASTLKLFTATSALTLLGPNYVFQTQFLTDGGNITNGILPGNLYVRFSGDPQLAVSDINNLINSLSALGIHQVQGNLVIDDTTMDRDNWAPGWQWDEQNACYAAPTNAIILNRNCIGFTVAPGKQSGGLAQIKVNPIFANMEVINQVTTNAVNCPIQLKAAGPYSYVLTGCIKPHRSTLSVGMSLHDTRIAGTNIVSGLLKQHGIAVAGNIQYYKTPNNVRVLASHDSAPLSALVTRMLKKSDNIIAGSLYKRVGSVYFNTTGNWQNSAQAVRAILMPRTGIDFSKVVIVDGSGLSRYDAVSPVQFGKLLFYGYHSMPNNAVFMQALPISGTDGTLKNRMGGITVGKIRAKTGTLDNTSGLAGYVNTKSHGTLIFAILINSPTGNQGTYHALQDRICQFLALNTPPSATNTNTAAPAPVTTPVKAVSTINK